MDNDTPKDPSASPGQRIGTAILVIVVSIPLSAVLYSVAPIVAAVGGIVGAAWLVSKSDEIRGRWSGIAFFCSFYGFPITMLAIGGVLFLLLSGPAWLLSKAGVFELD